MRLLSKIKTGMTVVAMTLFSFHTMHAQDAKSTEIINGLIQKVKTAKSVMANFTLVMKDAKGNKKNTVKGKLTMKGDKYMVDLNDQSITSDGANVYTYLKKNNEVQISSVANSAQALSPAKLFNGDFLRDFVNKYLGQSTFMNKTVEVIELTPKVAKKEYTKVQLFIDPVTKLITGGNVYEKSGNFVSYAISNIITTKAVQDAFFVFDTKKYKDIEVIDLR